MVEAAEGDGICVRGGSGLWVWRWVGLAWNRRFRGRKR